LYFQAKILKIKWVKAREAGMSLSAAVITQSIGKTGRGKYLRIPVQKMWYFYTFAYWPFRGALVLLLPYLRTMKNAILLLSFALLSVQGLRAANARPMLVSLPLIEDVDGPTPEQEHPPFAFLVKDKRLEIKMDAANQSGRVFLFDILGNKVLEANANDAIDWSLAGLKSGVYFIVWKDAKASYTKKFLYKQEG
jgi:hypothetical protein